MLDHGGGQGPRNEASLSLVRIASSPPIEEHDATIDRPPDTLVRFLPKRGDRFVEIVPVRGLFTPAFTRS